MKTEAGWESHGVLPPTWYKASKDMTLTILAFSFTPKIFFFHTMKNIKDYT